MGNDRLQLRRWFETLAKRWGPQHWWPADTAIEVIVGAFLTQNTAWTNVEQAMANLKSAGVLSLHGLRAVPLRKLEQLVRPSGYFRQKAQRLKTFARWLDERHGGSLERMFAEPTPKLREKLLELNGVGPETADSILLYAGGHASFVVDAYTRRILERHEIIPHVAKYDEVRVLLEESLGPHAERLAAIANSVPLSRARAAHEPSGMSRVRRAPTAQVYSEMHAYIVGIGKEFCLKREAQCEQCPLRRYLPSK